MRLIDADALMERSTIRDRVIGAEWVITAPTIDAVPIVRCRDCRWCYLRSDGLAMCQLHSVRVTANYFCASGKKEEQEKAESVPSEPNASKTKQASKLLLAMESEHLEVWNVGADVCVCYANCEVKDGAFLIGEFGIGKNFEEACEDYLAKIRGKTLIFHACTSRRKEVTVLG